MNKEQIHHYVQRYLDASGCTILEKSPVHIKVNLSPEADKALTNRPYYWNFVERTGAPAETMTLTFVFDADAYEQQQKLTATQGSGNRSSIGKPGNNAASGSGNAPDSSGGSILGRYFGFVPQTNRTVHETLHYGAGRMQQIFQVVKQNGKYVWLYEVPGDTAASPVHSAGYTSWLGVNYKVEYVCDMKRSDVYSLGISLSTGEIITDFQQLLNTRSLTPKMPPRMHLKETISLERAVSELERYLEQQITQQDHTWSYEALERMKEEQERIEGYYKELIERVENEEKPEAEAEYANRKSEIEWQYKPRITVSVMNCGIFNLLDESLRQK